ncbi:MAG: site-specific integrase [Ignavibacteriota bacterium]
MQFKNASLAPRTVSSYASDFRTFQSWGQAAGRSTLPASADTVELYVTDLIGRGRKIATAERHAFAIQHTHRENKQPNPCGPGLWELLAGARRILCQSPAQKAAISLEDLRAMVKAIGQDSPIALRNRALLLFGWASALRRSNLASLQLQHLTFTPKGILVRVDREKQDRKGKGRELAVPFGKRKITCPVRAMERWLEVRGGNQTGPVFCRVMRGHPNGKPILGNRIAQIVQECAAAIGKDPAKHGAHSLRAGLATEGLERGINEVALVQQTGHKSLDTLRIYLRSRDLFKGNACTGIGL